MRMGTMRCPKCRKMINERDRKCIYCGFDGIVSYKAALKRTENEINKKQQEKWHKAIHKAMESGNSETKNNVPKCPTCSSVNIKKIGSVNKTISIALLGIFSSNIGKQFQCLECGYKW